MSRRAGQGSRASQQLSRLTAAQALDYNIYNQHLLLAQSLLVPPSAGSCLRCAQDPCVLQELCMILVACGFEGLAAAVPLVGA